MAKTIDRPPSQATPAGLEAGEYYSVRQAAAILGVSTQRVYVLIKSGRIGGVRVGDRCWLLSREWVLARKSERIEELRAELTRLEEVP